MSPQQVRNILKFFQISFQFIKPPDSPLPKSSPSPSPQDVTDFDNIFDKNWDAVQPEVEVEKEQIVPEQPQRKQKKNKPPAKKLSPHRKDCPNENATFAIVRNMYSTCNDSYLWDFFVRCKGDADWCVNLLCDENLTDQMDAGCSLTCNCFGNEVSKVVVEKAKKVAQPQPSPTVKSKKAKTDAAKQINVDDWLETKEIIEKSIQIGHEHYPDHVNKVRGWKSGQDVTPAEQDNVTRFDERQELTIDRSLILELDVKYGEGLLEGVLGREIRFPSKIMIRKSTAFQLYLEIMEAHYVPEEDSRLKMLKADEELAKKLNDEENKKNEKKPEILMNGNNVWANMNNGDDGDDIALKMSKEKLVQLFPGLNKNDLLEIFEGTGYNFDDTVSLIEDSLITTPEERKEIAASKRKIFNSPWHDESEKKTVVVVERPTVSSDTGYTEEHLKTLEDLRQEIDYHQEEQKVCKMKAQESHQKKQYELATYYSNVAFFHHGREAEKKHEGANLMAGIHEKTHGSNSETVDLHFHSVLEATAVLDNFLDRQIEKLRKIKKPWVELSIITGKGTHSSNGLANIKIKTKSRLMERNLQ